MYTSFRVKNYRCFEDLTVESLERVNLIAGKNNVGKSALLEAVYLLCQRGNPWAAAFVNAYRGVGDPKPSEFLWELFGQFDRTQIIELAATDSEDARNLLRITADHRKTGIPLSESRPTTGFVDAGTRISISADMPPTGMEPRLTLHYSRGSGEIHESALVLGRDGKITHEAPEEIIKDHGIFLTARHWLGAGFLADKLSDLVRLKKDCRATEILRLLEPRLERLQPLSRAGQNSVFAEVGFSRLIPLSLMGEGLGHLLEIVLAMMAPEIQVLLVDEIENGLHHSVMTDIWKAIATAAREFDVQVFATTHSDECIRAAHQAFSDSDTYDFRLHRLELVKNRIQAVTFSQDALDFALEHGWEVR